MNKLLYIIIFLLTLGKISAQSSVTIGNGTSAQAQPFGMWYGYERSAALYRYSDIASYGMITVLEWYVATANPATCPTKIYLKCTADDNLGTKKTWASMINEATLVYDATVNFSTDGWYSIDVADFAYTASNLLVLCETNYGVVGPPTYPTFRYSYSSNRLQYWKSDGSPPLGNGEVNSNRPNIRITYNPLGNPVPPSGFMASPVSNSQIDLDWSPNTVADDVMVAFNTTGVFGVPSGTYLPGDAISGGGTVIYNGAGNSFSQISGLNPGTVYFYNAWSVHSPGPAYSEGTVANAATYCGLVTSFPYVIDLENNYFPPLCWSVAGLPWTRSTSASGYGVGDGSVTVDFFNIVSGEFDLISPELNLNGLTNPVIEFDHAYATWETQVDKLELWYSENNGTTYTLLTTWLGGPTGPLNTGGATTNAFVPDSQQWATKSYGLPPATNRIMLRGISLNGNNLYLDNITFSGEGAVPTSLTWNGVTSTNWDVPGNWTPSGVPTGTQSVTIPSGTTHSPAANVAGLQCNNLTISAGATLLIENTGILTVLGNAIIQDSGTLNNQGLLILKGNLDNQNPN